MRYKKIASMFKLLLVFFKRSVLNFGILKSKAFSLKTGCFLNTPYSNFELINIFEKIVESWNHEGL